MRFKCLNCGREWEGEVGSRCWGCHSRCVVEQDTFDRAVEAVRKLKSKVLSLDEKVTIQDVLESIVQVTDVTGRFRGRPLVVRDIRRRILEEAGL